MISGYGKKLELMLLIFLIFVATRLTSQETCSVDVKVNVALVSVHVPARVIQILDNETTIDDCYERCCQYRGIDGELCTAVSTYTSSNIRVCVLLHCVPFINCTWKNMDSYYAARIIHESLPLTTATTPLATTTIATTTSVTLAPETSIETESNNWNVIEPTSFDHRTQTTTLSSTLLSDSQPNDHFFNNTHKYIEDYIFPELSPSTSDNNGGNDDSYGENAGDGSDTDREPSNDKQITSHQPSTTHEIPLVEINQNDIWKNDDSSIFNLSPSDKFYVIVAVGAIVTTMMALSIIMFKKFNRRNRQYRSLRDYNVRVETPSSTSLLQRD